MDSAYFKKWYTRRQLAIILSIVAFMYEMVGNVALADLLVHRALSLDTSCFLASKLLWTREFRCYSPARSLERLNATMDANPVYVVGQDVWRTALVRMPLEEGMAWRPPQPEDYYWPQYLAEYDTIFKDKLHPLLRPAKAAKPETPKAEEQETDQEQQQKEADEPYKQYEPPKEARKWGALEWYSLDLVRCLLARYQLAYTCLLPAYLTQLDASVYVLSF